MTNKTKRKLSAFNLFMKTEISKVKKAHPNLSHMDAFKKAAHNWKGSNKAHAVHPHKGKASRTRKGRKDFVTHKGDKDFNKHGKRQHKSRKPYHKRGKSRKSRKSRK